jgi:hypothetical protein
MRIKALVSSDGPWDRSETLDREVLEASRLKRNELLRDLAAAALGAIDVKRPRAIKAW